MKSLVLYVSISGNTKKIAETIAMEANGYLFDISALTEDQKKNFWEDYQTELVFVGSGIYAAHIHSDMRRFLLSYKPTHKRYFALFGTWLGWIQSAHSMENFKKYLVKEGFEVLDPFFLCLGNILFFNQAHPNEQDLQNTKLWAQEMVRRYQLFSGKKK
jgi:flavodoxin